MPGQAEYRRYQDDQRVLVAVGRWLRDAPVGAALPSQLQDAALRAWQRDECDTGGVEVESEEQRRARDAAGTLALIGVAVERAREQATELSLHPETVAEAI